MSFCHIDTRLHGLPKYSQLSFERGLLCERYLRSAMLDGLYGSCKPLCGFGLVAFRVYDSIGFIVYRHGS